MEEEIQHELMSEFEAAEAALKLENREPQDVIAWAVGKFGQRLVICSSFQAEACALIDMAWRIDSNIHVFTIDTGRLPQETYDIIDKIRDRYGIKTEVFLPDNHAVQNMVTEHGNNLFYREV